MEIQEVLERTPAVLETLLTVWESSVKATHLFLTDAEIEKIKTYVPGALKSVERLCIAEEDGETLGFMGAENGRLEMLFLAPNARGRGLGKALLLYGVEHYGVRELTVNEQNPQAVGFYEHMGFKTYKRTALDEAGDPYPLLYMRRELV